jgi:hypothetical protein
MIFAPHGVVKSPDIGKVRVAIDAVCHDCKQRHKIDVEPDLFGRAAFDWEWKHREHRIEFLSPKRTIPKRFSDWIYNKLGLAPWWLEYAENADIKIAYAADGAFTITLASLATSSTFVAGRESTSVSNGTNKYLDYEITGKITTGTTPIVDRSIILFGVKPINDTPTWPDVFDGTDSAETITNAQIMDAMPILWRGGVSATSDIGYPIINALTIAQAWGLVPDNFSVFVAHNTNVNLHATGGNHEINYRGVYLTST